MQNQPVYPAIAMSACKEIGLDSERRLNASYKIHLTGKKWRKAKQTQSGRDAHYIRRVQDYRSKTKSLKFRHKPLIADGKITRVGEAKVNRHKRDIQEDYEYNRLENSAKTYGLAKNWRAKDYDSDIAFTRAFRDYFCRQLKKQGCERDAHTSKRDGIITSAYFSAQKPEGISWTQWRPKTIRVSDHEIQAAPHIGRDRDGWGNGPDMVLDIDLILSKKPSWWRRAIVLTAHGRYVETD